MNMVETHNTKPIASTRVGDNGTVLVMGIHYDEALTCDRKCSVLGPDDDGILVCGYDNVKNIVNFQTRALVIDYQCILDRDADENWRLYKGDFKVIDSDGFIHDGDVLCEMMLYPIKSVENGHTLYKGTRANIVIFYPDFPKEKTISAIVIDKSYSEKSRIELGSTSFDMPAVPVVEGERENVKNERRVFNPRNPDDLFDRIDRLEEAVRELQEKIGQLTEGGTVDVKPHVTIPPPPEKSDEVKISIKTIGELLALDPTEFRDVMIKMLQGQGFKNIETNSDPNVGYGAMTGSRFGTSYAIFTVQENQSNYSSDLKKVKWLISFQNRHRQEKAIYITSAKLSPEAESEALANHVEVLDIDRLASMLALRNDSFGYRPLQH